MSTQIVSLVDGVLSRDLESLERRKRQLELKHEDKVKIARRLVDGKIENSSQSIFRDQAAARSFLAQCSMKPTDAPSIETAPIGDYHDWALVSVEIQRLRLTRQKLVDRIRSDYALGRLRVA